MSAGSFKTIFFDRDGVILMEKNFVAEIKDMEFIPGSITALKGCPAEYLKIIVSNQSGVGRGYFTAGKVDLFNREFSSILKKNGVLIDKIYYCPHSPDDNCGCRKPKTGMFNQADLEFGIDFGNSWVIGDKSSDIQAGKNIGAKTILVQTGYAGREPGHIRIEPDFTAINLLEAMEIIKNAS